MGYGRSLYCSYNFSSSLKIFQNDILKFFLLFILVFFFLISPFLTSDKDQQSRPPDTPAGKQSEVCELAAATRNPKHLYGRGQGRQQGGRWEVAGVKGSQSIWRGTRQEWVIAWFWQRPVRIYKPEGSWTSRWFIFRAQESLRSDCQTILSLALPEWMFGSVWTVVKSLNMDYGGHHGVE